MATSKKTAAGEMGELTLEAPRDRDAKTFEPQLIPSTSAGSPASTKRSLPSTPKGMTHRDNPSVVIKGTLRSRCVAQPWSPRSPADLDAEVTGLAATGSWMRSGPSSYPRRHRRALRGDNGRVSAAHDVRGDSA